MAIAVEHANMGRIGQDPSSTTVAFNTTATVAAGGFIIVGIGSGSNPTVTVAGGGLTWTTNVQGVDAGGPSACFSAIATAHAPAGLASGTTITATFSAGVVARTITSTSFTGVATSSAVEATGAPEGQNIATTAWTSLSVALSAGSMLFAHCLNETSNPTSTPTSPAVEAHDFENTASGITMTSAYRIEASPGSFTVAGTWGSAVKSTTVAVAVLEAASAAVPVGNRVRRWQY